MRHTRKHLDSLVDEKLSQLTEFNASSLTGVMLESIMELTNGDSLMIKWFGTFKCIHAKSKIIPNILEPHDDVEVKAHNRIYFKAGKAFKEFINEDSS